MFRSKASIPKVLCRRIQTLGIPVKSAFVIRPIHLASMERIVDTTVGVPGASGTADEGAAFSGRGLGGRGGNTLKEMVY